MRTCMFGILGAALLVGACGGKKGDDCQQVWEKTSAAMKAVSGKLDKPMPADAGDKFLKECRETDKMKKDPVFSCVLKASGNAEVTKCMSGAFDDYMAKAKKTEAQLNLNKLAKDAKVAFMTEDTYPIGKAGPTPAGPCCTGPDHKCPVVAPEQWQADPVWSKLDFQIDEPTQFTYSYESTDGKTATATAIGDLDCDGKSVTYKLEMATADGAPSTVLTPPPPGAM